MIRSVGTLYAIQDLFDHLSNHSVAETEFLQAFSKYGSSTAQDVYQTSTSLSWICTADSGQLVPTELGKTAHQGTGRASRLRFQLANIVETTRPVWAGLLPKGRKEAAVGFPSEIRQCFEEAMLLGDLNDDVVSWWDKLSGIMREVSQRRLMETGRTGERLTLQFERNRTGIEPKWQSVETNYAGYDVLSLKSKEDHTPLKIEVKASDRTFKQAKIHLTQHEWITASQAPETYVFHVWLIDPKPVLFVIPSLTIIHHIPQNQGKGLWRNTEIPLGAITSPHYGVAMS